MSMLGIRSLSGFGLVMAWVFSGCGSNSEPTPAPGAPAPTTEPPTTEAPPPPPIVTPKDGSDVQRMLDEAADGATVTLPPGEFKAVPTPYTDPFCGNCKDAEYGVATTTTIGFTIKGKKQLTLRGSGDHATTLVTGAGYGLYLEGNKDLKIENLRITGGLVSKDTRSADGVIVVRDSNVVLDQLLIENHPSPEWNRGICGLVAREGATVRLERSTIRNITRNAVALYRGSAAEILGNVFDNGRQPALDITWDSKAVVIGNEIRGFWKGIGVFVEPRAFIANNVIEAPINGWGFATSFRRPGQHFTFANNLIWRTSSCGLLVDQDDTTTAAGAKGRIQNNVVWETGYSPNNPVYICEADALNVRGQSLNAGYDIGFNTFAGSARFSVFIGSAEATLSPESETQTGDPMVDIKSRFRPLPGSPLLNTGAPGILDPDGRRSTRGPYGGPWSWDVTKKPGYRYPEGLLAKLL